MSNELEAICEMLEKPDPELQMAAARVLSELGSKDAAVVKALARALKHGNEQVKVYALQALGKVGAEKAVDGIVGLLGDSERVRKQAVAVLVGLGKPAVEALSEGLGKAPPERKRATVEVLGRIGGAEAIDLLEGLLEDPDPEVVRVATASLRSKLEGISAKEKEEFRARALKLLRKPDAKKGKPSAIAALKILGFLRDPENKKILLPFVDKRFPAPVRSNALRSLGSLAPVLSKDRAIESKMYQLLDDPDYEAVGSAALSVLGLLREREDAVGDLLGCLESRQQAVKIFGIRGLGERPSDKVGQKLIELLWDENERVREESVSTLKQCPKFSGVVLKGFQRLKDPGRAWLFVSLLKTYAKAIPSSAGKRFLREFFRQTEKGGPMARPYLEAALAVVPELVGREVLRRATDLARKEKYAPAQQILGYLEGKAGGEPEARLLRAVLGLKLSSKSLSREARQNDTALRALSTLARETGFPLGKQLEKLSKILDASDYFYMGFHFTEGVGEERALGTALLRFVAKRYPRSEEGKSAKQKLKTEGLTK